jgi:hypothetical protein
VNVAKDCEGIRRSHWAAISVRLAVRQES